MEVLLDNNLMIIRLLFILFISIYTFNYYIIIFFDTEIEYTFTNIF